MENINEDTIRKWKNDVVAKHGDTVSFSKHNGGFSGHTTVARKNDTIVGSFKHKDSIGHVLNKLSEDIIDEKTLTPNEVAKKEEIVKSLKKKKADFVKRYGADRAKGVMYATATKVAKAVAEETIENIDEDAAQQQMTNAMDNIPAEKRNAARATYKKARSTGLPHAASINIMMQRHMKNEEVSEEQLDEMGYGSARAADHSFGDTGAVVPQKKTKYLVKHKATGKILSIHDNAPAAVAARDKAGSYETHSIIKEEDLYKEMQRVHLEQTGELLTLNQIRESDSAIDGSEKGPISRASAKHGRIKPMSGTKTIATKIATILSKKV